MPKFVWVLITEYDLCTEIYGIYSTRELAVLNAQEKLIADEHIEKIQDPKDTDDWTYKKWTDESCNVIISRELVQEG